jgi:hypothetical protein
MTKKYTIAQILAAWDAAFGEDMMTEYPGFIQRLTESQKQQATSGKLQAASSKLDK